MSLIVKCPVCEEKGTESRVFPLGHSSTLMGSSPFYDETGVYHSHDPNATTSSYRCSNGHIWNVKSYNSCPACEWTGGKTLVIAPKGQ